MAEDLPRHRRAVQAKVGTLTLAPVYGSVRQAPGIRHGQGVGSVPDRLSCGGPQLVRRPRERSGVLSDEVSATVVEEGDLGPEFGELQRLRVHGGYQAQRPGPLVARAVRRVAGGSAWLHQLACESSTTEEAQVSAMGRRFCKCSAGRHG